MMNYLLLGNLTQSDHFETKSMMIRDALPITVLIWKYESRIIYCGKYLMVKETNKYACIHKYKFIWLLSEL